MKQGLTQTEIQGIPEFNSMRNTPDHERMVYMHFYEEMKESQGESHWFISEYSKDRELFFGYAIPAFPNPDDSGWKNIKQTVFYNKDLSNTHVIQDPYWIPRRARNVDLIRLTQKAKGSWLDSAIETPESGVIFQENYFGHVEETHKGEATISFLINGVDEEQVYNQSAFVHNVLPEESSYVYMHVMMQKIREEDIALNDSDLDRILESEDFCGPTPLDETIQN